ncbi:GNAT family N-acetyltransferase [uncultured Psychrobacter sp.]|uniref:GNAT family N-acetyltransferase n=1 Tax=uncultured Psychrobacter sp. TaxID=259303 RepID=UPI003457AF89
MEMQELSCSYAKEISTMYQEIYDSLYMLGSVYTSPKLDKYLKFICEEKIETFLGFVGDDELAAVAQYKKTDEYLYTNHIVVRPAYQGEGLARKLLMRMFEIADAEGLEVRGDVNPASESVYAWYLKVGYLPVSETTVSILKLDNQNPSPIKFEDEDKYTNFGISNSRLDNSDLEDLEFFSIAPNTLVLKTPIEAERVGKLCDAVNGHLIIETETLPEEYKSKSIHERGNIKLVRPPVK